jgi:hypothetical protein
VADIQAASGNKLAHAFDCISTDATAAICAEAMGPQGGKYSSLLTIKSLPRADVENLLTLAYTACGERFVLMDNMEFPAKREDFEYAVMFWALARDLLVQGKFKVHPPSVRNGGLEGILEGLDEMRQDKVSGEKLVYRIS